MFRRKSWQSRARTSRSVAGPTSPIIGGNVAPIITSSSTTNNAENSVLSHSLTANETVTWSIVGGVDQARFEISGSTLRWASNGTKDFETPDDADTNNTYVVTVRATDTGSLSTDQTITVTVTDVTIETTLDGTATNVTISNGGLTATHSNTSTAGARTTVLKDAGKFYYEVTATDLDGASDCIGVLTAAGTYTNLVTDATNCSVVYKNTGNIYSNNANSGRSLGPIVDGDVIGLAVDLDNNKVWFRKAPSGNWNGQVIGSQNPATNTGGVSISNYSATTLGPALGFHSSGETGDNMTVNFGGSAFVGTPPSGFTANWA